MLDGRTVFITGASRGIGRKIAREAAAEGANVALAARSDGILETADPLPDDRVLTVRTDVTDEASIRSAVAETVETFGGLDGLVNNAGIAGPTAAIEDVEKEGIEHTLSVNVTGSLLTCKHAVPHLQESDRGSIVNISSISGKRPLPERSPYTASKMAVIGMTRTLAVELGDDDVTVNAVCPGATNGERMERTLEKAAAEQGITVEEAREYFTDDAALGRFVDPEDVAGMVVYLLSEKGANVTAQDINVDAGTTWY